MMPVVESLPALVVLDKMYYSCCCAGLNVVNNNNNNNNRIEQQKRSKGLLFFDETFLAHQKTLSSFFPRHFNLETTCINASSPKARRGVSSLSLILFFYCYSARGVKIYI